MKGSKQVSWRLAAWVPPIHVRRSQLAASCSRKAAPRARATLVDDDDATAPAVSISAGAGSCHALLPRGGTHVHLDQLLAVHLLAGVHVERDQRVLLAARDEDARVAVRLDRHLGAALHARAATAPPAAAAGTATAAGAATATATAAKAAAATKAPAPRRAATAATCERASEEWKRLGGETGARQRQARGGRATAYSKQRSAGRGAVSAARAQPRVAVAGHDTCAPPPLDVSSRSRCAAPPPPPARTTTAAEAAATPAGCTATETAPAATCIRSERGRKVVAEGRVSE